MSSTAEAPSPQVRKLPKRSEVPVEDTWDLEIAGAHSNLGAALQRLGRYEEAERQYREALRLDPGLENARRNLDALMRRRAVPRGTRPPD